MTTTIRITRGILVIAGVLQTIRRQISLYDLALLSSLCNLLAVPTLFAEEYSSRINTHSTLVRSYLKRLPILAVSLCSLFTNFALTLATCQNIAFCPGDPGQSVAFFRSPPADRLLPNQYFRVSISVLIDFILILPLLFPLPAGHRTPSSRRHIVPDTLNLLTVTCLLAWSLELFIRKMDETVFANVRDDWGFGQLTALLGLIAIVVQIWEFSKGMRDVDPVVPRHKYWRQRGSFTIFTSACLIACSFAVISTRTGCNFPPGTACSRPKLYVFLRDKSNGKIGLWVGTEI